MKLSLSLGELDARRLGLEQGSQDLLHDSITDRNGTGLDAKLRGRDAQWRFTFRRDTCPWIPDSGSIVVIIVTTLGLLGSAWCLDTPVR